MQNSVNRIKKPIKMYRLPWQKSEVLNILCFKKNDSFGSHKMQLIVRKNQKRIFEISKQKWKFTALWLYLLLLQ